MRQFPFKILTLILMAAAAATGTSGQTAEDYIVYDAVVRSMFRDGITQFDMGAKVDKIVIRDRTHSEYARGLNKEAWDYVKTVLRALDDETIRGYESVRKDEKELKANFDIPLKYSLVSDKQLKEIVPHPNDATEYWTKFYEVYPNSGGYNSFSRVGYDKSGRKALVYFVNWCGPLCGTGTYVLVEKVEKGWAVKETAGIWIS